MLLDNYIANIKNKKKKASTGKASSTSEKTTATTTSSTSNMQTQADSQTKKSSSVLPRWSLLAVGAVTAGVTGAVLQSKLKL